MSPYDYFQVSGFGVMFALFVGFTGGIFFCNILKYFSANEKA